MYQTTWISNHFGNPQILAQRGTGVSVELRYSSNAQLMTNQTCRTSYLYDLQTQKERQVWARWRERQSHRVYNLTRSQTFTVTTALKYWNILSLRNQIGTMTTSLQFRFESFTFRISAPLEQEVMLNSLIYIHFYFIVLLTLCFVTGVECRPTLSHQDLLSVFSMNSILHSTGVCVADQSDFSGVKCRKHGNISSSPTTWHFEKGFFRHGATLHWQKYEHKLKYKNSIMCRPQTHNL